MKTLCRPLSVLLAATLALMSACAVPVTQPPPVAAPTSPPVVKQLETLAPTAVPQPTIAVIVAPTAAPPPLMPTAVPPPPKPAEPQPLIAPEQVKFEGKVDIGGRSLYLNCQGKGFPTIVFDAGMLGTGSFMLNSFDIAYPKDTRVCVYDRPNVYAGGSDRIARLRTSQDVVDDLWALLTKAGLKPPYVLIGFSLGGLNLTHFAAQHQTDVAGLILLDPLPPGTFEEWVRLVNTQPRSGVAQAVCGAASGIGYCQMTELSHAMDENIDMAASTAAMEMLKPLANIPVTMIASSRPLAGWTSVADPSFEAKLAEAWKARRPYYIRIAPKIEVIEVNESHMLNGDASNAAVSKTLARMVERARNLFPPINESAVLKIADSYVGPLADQDKFGGAVLIARDGKVLLNKGYGFADRDKKTAFGPDSQFLIPLAEPWPALVSMLLKEQTAGKFNLDDSVCKFIADCPAHYKPITFRHLLANAGGVPDVRFDKEASDAMAGNWTNLANYSVLPEAKFGKPGAAFSSASGPNGSRLPAEYGNWAWSYIVSGLALNNDISALHATRVAGTLGMTTSGRFNLSNARDVVTLYDGAKPASARSDGFYGSQVLSTADLNKFVQALFNGTLLTPAELQEMLKPMVKVDTMPGDMSYGLGVYVGNDPAGNTVVSQVDVRQGFGAYWAYYPDSKLTIIVMNNLTDWANQPYRARDIGLLLARVTLAAR